MLITAYHNYCKFQPSTRSTVDEMQKFKNSLHSNMQVSWEVNGSYSQCCLNGCVHSVPASLSRRSVNDLRGPLAPLFDKTLFQTASVPKCNESLSDTADQSRLILTTQAWKQTLPPSDQTLYYTSASV